MVNTFITELEKCSTHRFTPDYSASAKNLDQRRLLKQCVEAFQILRICEHLSQIAEYENWERLTPVSVDEVYSSPTDMATLFLQRVEWVKYIRKRYLSLSYRLAIFNGEIIRFPSQHLPYRINKSKDWWIEKDGGIIVWSMFNDRPPYSKYTNMSHPTKNSKRRKGYWFPRDKIILPTDELITLGFSQHAIIKMWIGYEDSLREYINAHIFEYRSRFTTKNKKCTIDLPTYTLNYNYPHPWWLCLTDVVVLSHRASLLRKEKNRKEDKWYSLKDHFTQLPHVYLERGYVWVGSLSQEKIVSIINDQFSLKDVSEEIHADIKPKKSQKYLRQKYNYDGEFYLDEDGFVLIR